MSYVLRSSRLKTATASTFTSAQSVGYGVVVGVGFFFAGLMLLLTFIQSKFTSLSPRSSEEARLIIPYSPRIIFIRTFLLNLCSSLVLRGTSSLA